MKLDRVLQLELLKKLAETYPMATAAHKLNSPAAAPLDESALSANLYYLMEHGLITAKTLNTGDGVKFANATITAAGMDFLADDGGLSAILGVVTVKLHDETIRDLIAARIQESELPVEEKTGLLNQLKELRGESIKHLTMKLLDAGLENLPAALPLIQKALGGFL